MSAARKVNPRIMMVLTLTEVPMRVLLILIAALPLLQGARFELSHIGKIARVSDPQIAPDGKSIVVVVSRPNYQENRHEAELVLVDAATGVQHTLTRQRRSVSFPRWSPS